MNTAMRTGHIESSPTELADQIRNTLHQLEQLDRDSSDYLSALAFILHRVAAADGNVCEFEVQRMETILIEHASVTQAQAILVVEIARQRAKLADCCCRYGVSKELRPRLDEAERKDLLSFLDAVAQADGFVRRCEEAEIHQVATELGLHAELISEHTA